MKRRSARRCERPRAGIIAIAIAIAAVTCATDRASWTGCKAVATNHHTRAYSPSRYATSSVYWNRGAAKVVRHFRPSQEHFCLAQHHDANHDDEPDARFAEKGWPRLLFLSDRKAQKIQHSEIGGAARRGLPDCKFGKLGSACNESQIKAA